MAVVNALKIILKNSYAIYLKTKNATRAHPAPTSGTFTCFSLCHSQHRHAHDAWYPGAVAGAECNTVIELKPEHHAALPWNFA